MECTTVKGFRIGELLISKIPSLSDIWSNDKWDRSRMCHSIAISFFLKLVLEQFTSSSSSDHATHVFNL
jgi:hypothetical protein